MHAPKGFPLLLVLGLTISTAGDLWAQERPWAAPEYRHRPLIVFIHGRAQAEKTRDELQRVYFESFRDGLGIERRDMLSFTTDMVMVTYEDIYERWSPNPVCPADTARHNSRREQSNQRVSVAEVRLTGARVDLAAAEGSIRLAAQLNTRERFRGEIGSAPSAAEMQRIREQARVAAATMAPLRKAVEDAEAALLAEQNAAMAIEEALVEEDAMLDDAYTIAQGPGDFLNALAEVATATASRFHVTSEAFLRLFADTDKYFKNRRVRCATNARLESVLSDARRFQRPVVLVGHSMGTIVSHDVLYGPRRERADQTARSSTGYTVHRFVTLGSQLGLDATMRHLYGSIQEPFPYPSSVYSWVNLRGLKDFVAPRLMRDRYQPAPRHFSEFEIPTKAGVFATHDISGYLQNPAVAQAIMFTWCRGFSSAPREHGLEVRPPAQCRAYASDVAEGLGGARAR